ncbi:uncharacterized protein LOC122388995 [Amphibalanus amphitrite]|uniref:uncharacterized protein LOC122388995 n=1 Tax=Amphibalanus amphitrite TaxID=1232801 RepID=UPI001C90E67A|nr:uncharacterized protein LOC122388995 [Amphibalanus amphitrite]
MSVPYSGTKKFANGVISAIIKQLKTVSLKPAKRVVFRFDPFTQPSQQVRNLMWYMSAGSIRETNPKCTFKTEIANDRGEPTILVQLDSDKSVLFKAGNLTELEVLQLWNQHITPLAAPTDGPSKSAAAGAGKTKAGKARLR